MKQATHFHAAGETLFIKAVELGGYVVDVNDTYRRDTAAFSTADECANWVRAFLRDADARKFGVGKK